jgi:hypothetical protein
MILTVVVAALGLLSASSAAASFETVDHFGGTLSAPPGGIFPEEVQLGGLSGMAINRTGAGGVAPGTLYTAGYNAGEWHAARFSPEGEFELAWTQLKRCGPKSGEPPKNPNCAAVPDAPNAGVDIEVDQTTGNVYVFFAVNSPTPPDVVRVYNPDASELIAEFGEQDASPGKGTIATSPSKYHRGGGNIAVNDAGEVYLYDEDQNFQHRLMVFKPKTPGDYSEYEYSGEIISGSGAPGPGSPVLDEDGNIYTLSGDDFIGEYDSTGTLLCSFSLATGGITSMTVNPETGEPFYYNGKIGERKIYQLSACDSEGKFMPIAGGKFSAVPQRGEITAMAFNPLRQYEPSRPLGVLYAGTAEVCPSTGSCPPEAVGRGPLGYILAQPEEIPPVVESESVIQVTKASATLSAQINPKGSLTSYAFQYIDLAAWEANEASDRFAGAVEVPVGGAVLGGGQQALSASAPITGLIPDAVYHYRAIATSHCAVAEPSKVCEDRGDDQAFRTFPNEALGLPDRRAWELVSPIQKGGGQVLPAEPSKASCGTECKPGIAAARYPTVVTADGNGIAYQGTPFTLNEGPSEYDEHISRRTPSGWQTTHLGPPLAGAAGGAIFEAFALSSDLEAAIVFATNPSLTPEAPADYRNLFAEQTDNRFGFEPLLKQAPPNRTPKGLEPLKIEYAGASEDLSRIFFAANDALTGETPFAPEAVDGGVTKDNLYEWSGGELHLVNVQPGNAETIPGTSFGSGVQLSQEPPPAADFSYAISPDGSHVFWSSDSGQVYVRDDGETTTEIPDHVGKFLSASVDGSKLLLSDGVIYDLEAETSTDLTEGKGGFQGLVGQSDDLSHVYFVDTEVLDGAPNDQGAMAEAGKSNLYAWSEGGLAYVASLRDSDNEQRAVWAASPVRRAAQASPNGRWLAFNSPATAGLTGIDSIGACKFDQSTLKYSGSAPCVEAFLYDSVTGELTCPSCNPVGEHPHGNSFPRVALHATGSQEQARYLTDQGRLFFDSADSLVVGDTNGNVEDVYQYEPQGVGTCKKENGCVSLISAGHEPNDSNFLAADPEGKNVFFTTRDALSLKDKDDLIDLYVAREDGGIQAETELARGECQGEACVATYTPPSDPTPGSSSFEGSGNVDEQKTTKKKHKKAHKKKKKQAKKHKRGKRSREAPHRHRAG